MLSILIVEDDAASRKALHEWVERQGHVCRDAADLVAARKALAETPPDLVLIDLELPDGSGIDLLAELREEPEIDAVMVSGKPTVDSAIGALRLGARDFLTKPIELPRLLTIVSHLERTAALRREVRTLRAELKRLGRFGDLVGTSPAMQAVYEQVERVAPTEETVLIVGPTGTGKEVTAATVHRLSRRNAKAFVAVNCGAVAPSLIESEFFGHERGSFTGADKQRRGLFEQADGGTLFLDEITEMPVELQVKLLRVLETVTVTRVGGTSPLKLDVRVIAATNQDPRQAVKEGSLREDLFYRLAVFPITLPPLSERGDDVLLLAQVFLDQLNAENGTGKTLTPEALLRLRQHAWPGNVRELRNAVRRAYILAGEILDADSLFVEPAGSAPVSGNGGIDVQIGMTIDQAERRLIEATLEQTGGDKRRAAETLGISLKTLYERLKVYRAAGPSS